MSRWDLRIKLALDSFKDEIRLSPEPSSSSPEPEPVEEIKALNLNSDQRLNIYKHNSKSKNLWYIDMSPENK